MKRKLYFVVLLLASLIFTLLVKFVDLAPIGPNSSEVGFSTINNFFASKIGFNQAIYVITEYLGYIALFVALAYAIIGLIELIKRKNIFKIDREILVLGGFYVVILMIYALFEVIIINYRPVLIDGVLEASFPSSHTLLALCICGSAIIVNKRIFNQYKMMKYFNILLYSLMISITFGRFISGAHWFTDIMGGLLISITLLNLFNIVVNKK